MRTKQTYLWLGLIALLGTGILGLGQPRADTARAAIAPTATPLTPPPVEGPEPSLRAAVFYYPWYGGPASIPRWRHWKDPSFSPPEDISSDYYPVLGAYSSTDPLVIAQHFAWLREAGVGVIITSWWGRGSYEDQAVPALLDGAATYGIKVAFHIEPYDGRTADGLVSDVQYLYERYGSHPAFYRTTGQSRWSADDRSKGLFFVWAIGAPDTKSPSVQADYWRAALDQIHALPDGGIVIGNSTQPDWVDGGHFDGLYNYATLHLETEGGFAWAQGLPPGAWYVPSVIPGMSARRIGYPENTYVPRQNGITYVGQWNAALGTGVEPQMVTITSFNEWHEGTLIEPAAAGANNGRGYSYTDFGTLPPTGYLLLTHDAIRQFLQQSWPEMTRARFRITTTSDWTTFGLVKGGLWMRPTLVSSSAEATSATMERGRYLLMQPISRANAGQSVEMVVDVLFSGLDPNSTLTFEIERGNLGSTTVELMNMQGAQPVVVTQMAWSKIGPDSRNTGSFRVSAEELLKK